VCPPADSKGVARGVAQSGSPTGNRPEAVRVWLLGGFRVLVSSRIIEESQWRLRKAAALVKLLTLAPGHRLHREQVMDLLWPDLGRKADSNNLRRVLPRRFKRRCSRKAGFPGPGSLKGSRSTQIGFCALVHRRFIHVL
jgi:DNA-binding response OmpR family regulator